MTHISEIDGREYEIGEIVSPDGGTYNITTVMYYPTEQEVEESSELYLTPEMVHWHFGDYKYDEVEEDIKNWLEKKGEK